MTRIAAIDQGTSSTKLAVLEPDGSIAVHRRAAHRTARPEPGWVEHDAMELLANVWGCLADMGPVAAVGLSNQGESCLAWDRVTKEPLSPVIVWQDRRTEAMVARLASEGAAALVRDRAGLPLDSYFSAPKFGWLLEHSAPVAQARRHGRLRLGTTDAFFLDHLTGECATDTATASRTSLLNLRSGAWDPVLCDLFGVPIDSLPEIRATVGGFGTVGGVAVTASVVDQQAALFGHGCHAPGDVKVTFGTGAFALAVTGPEPPAGSGGLLPTVAWRIGSDLTYALEGGVFDAGGAVDWARQIGVLRRAEDLAAFPAPAAIARGLAFVPALSGLGCPQWDRRAAGLWIGMTGATTAADLCQALVEGIAFQVADVLSALEAATAQARQVCVDGGLANSSYLLQFLADVSGRTVVRPAFHDVTCLGAALLAAHPRGHSRRPGDCTRFEPRDPCAAQWRDRFRDAARRSLRWH